MAKCARAAPKETEANDKSALKKAEQKRARNLMFAADSAIERLKQLSQPGGEIESMDIKDLKNLISSIKELAGVSSGLSGANDPVTGFSGGVVILPEVKKTE